MVSGKDVHVLRRFIIFGEMYSCSFGACVLVVRPCLWLVCNKVLFFQGFKCGSRDRPVFSNHRYVHLSKIWAHCFNIYVYVMFLILFPNREPLKEFLIECPDYPRILMSKSWLAPRCLTDQHSDWLCVHSF